MAAVQQEQEREVHDWEREVVDLKRQGLDTADIASAVDKHPATIRKAIAKAKERGELTESGTAFPQGDDGGPTEPLAGQTTVDDFTETCEHGVPILDECQTCDPQDEPARDPLDDFRAEAGEAVGPMPEREMDGGVTVEHRLAGTRQMALDLGPNAAPVLKATVKFVSEKWPSGFFGMGDIVKGTFTARIVSVPAKEKFDDASGEYRAKPVDHGALITEIEYEAVDPGD